MAEPFLRQFGSSMSRLNIIFSDDARANRTHFGHLINSYCSESLSMFKVISCDNDFFDVMLKPFAHVTDVSISGGFKKSHQKLGLNELFPAIRRLHLDLDWDSKVIDHHFHGSILRSEIDLGFECPFLVDTPLKSGVSFSEFAVPGRACGVKIDQQSAIVFAKPVHK